MFYQLSRFYTFMLGWCEPHIHTLHGGLVCSGRHYSLLTWGGVSDDSQVPMSSLKLRSPSNLPGVEVNWTFFITSPSLRWCGSYPSPLSCPPLEEGAIEGADHCDLNCFGILFCLLKSSHLHYLPLSLVDGNLLGGRENPI